MNELTTNNATANLAVAMQTAELYAKSDIVPKAFQGNAGNCFIALELAARMNAPAFMVMQNIDVIHGKPGFSAKFLIGCFNSCGRFSAINYEEDDQDGGRCRAISTELSSGKPVTGPWVSLNMAKAEGWSTKAGSKWVTMPGLMLRYRAAAFMVRVTAPEISLGLPTSEEIHDTEGFEKARNVTPKAELSCEANPFERAAIEEKPKVELSSLAVIAGNLEADKISVKDALGALLTLGIGDGKTPFSKMDTETLDHIAADWQNVRNVVFELRKAGGAA